MKNEEIYNPFDTVRLLNRPVRIGLTDKSGIAGVMAWMQDRYELPPVGERRCPHLRRSATGLRSEYEDGRVTAVSDEEMDEQVHRTSATCRGRNSGKVLNIIRTTGRAGGMRKAPKRGLVEQLVTLKPILELVSILYVLPNPRLVQPTVLTQ